jgi:PAS domain S-box-containing protein
MKRTSQQKEFSETDSAALHALIANEERLRMAMDALKIGTFDWNITTGEVFWSANLESIMGLPVGGFGKSFESFMHFVHHDDREQVQSKVRSVLEKGSEYVQEFRMVRTDGSVRWVEARAQIFFDEAGQPVRMLGIDIDVTERKRVEAQLGRSETECRARAAELEAILDTVPAMTFIAHDPQCQKMTSSRAAYEMLRLPHGVNTSKSAPEGERPTNFRPMRDGKELRPEELPVQQAAATGKPIRDCELTLQFEDGTEQHVLGNAAPLLDSDGRVTGAVGAFIDITERKYAEKALYQKQEYLHRTFENAAVGIASVALDGSLIQVNRKFCDITGYSREDLAGQTFLSITHPDDLAASRELVKRLMDHKTEHDSMEKRYLRPDGSVVWGNVWVSLVRKPDGSPDHFVAVVVDITARKHAEAKLRARELELEQAQTHLEARIHESTSSLETANRSLSELTSRLLQMRDDERRRISRELHDSAGQLLVALAMNTATLQREGTSELGRRVLADSEMLIQQILKEIRTISYLLHPPMIEEVGLPSSLDWFVAGFSERSKIVVKLDVSAHFPRLHHQTEIAIFRAVQESLTNVHRHSESKTAKVSLVEEAATVLLEISDYGIGMSSMKLAAIRSPGIGGVGFRGMRERIAQLQGTFEIESGSQGTVVRACFPKTAPEVENSVN